jgi:hypothetical protein
MAVLSFGNRKLPKDIAIFNLPRLITCTDSTELCRKVCYAKKAERECFPACKPQRMRNLFLSYRHDFVESMIKEISGSGRKKVRIHESGDFYNQEYLEKWFKIIRALPDVIFVAYTKSVLEYKNKPNNMILFFSADNSTMLWNMMWYKENKYKNAMAYIDMEMGEHCPGSCKTCDRCYHKETAVDTVFKQH